MLSKKELNAGSRVGHDICQCYDRKSYTELNTTRAHESYSEWAALIKRSYVHGIRNAFLFSYPLFCHTHNNIDVAHLCS
jgi:hypothetical protein